jgi:hypothetical protein
MRKVKVWCHGQLFILAGWMAPVLSAWADEDIGTKATRLSTDVNNVTSFVLTGMQLGGIALAVAGLFDIKKDKEQPGQGLMKNGLIKVLVVGPGLYFIPKVIGMGGATLFPS